jgi:hypothetical protein
MTKRIFRGDAPGQAQITRIKPPLVDGVVVLRVGNKSIELEAWSAAAIASAWNAATWPEFREVIATADANDLLLRARTAGVPFFLHISIGGNGGGLGQNETQVIALINGADGGTFNVAFDGDGDDVAWNVDGAGLQAALESLDTIEVGDVSVSGPAAGPWTIEFGGRFAGQNVPPILVDGTNLTGGNALVQITTIQNGGGTPDPLLLETDATQYGTVDVRDVPSIANQLHTTFAAVWRDNTVGFERSWHTVLRFPMALERGTDISSAQLAVVLPISELPNITTTVRVYAETADNASFPAGWSDAMSRPLTESYVEATITGGSGSRTISGLAALVQQVIDRTGWQSGNRVQLHIRAVSGGPMQLYSESGDYFGHPLPQLQINYSEQFREIQRVTLIGSSIRGGGVTLTLDDQTADPLPHDTTAAAAQAAIAALSNVGGGNVTATGGPWPLTPITFTFDAALGNLPQMTATHDLVNGDVQNTTTAQGGPAVEIIEQQRSRGPHHWDDELNWQDEDGEFGVPQSGDQAFCHDGRVDLLYGLAQRVRFTADAATDRLFLADGQSALRDGQAVRVVSADTLPGGLSADSLYYVRDVDPSGPSLRLAATPGGVPVAISSAGTGTHEVGVRLERLETDARYQGKLGLPRRHASGYEEYRPRFLMAWIDRAVIGRGSGGGSQRCHLDVSASQATIQVQSSGGGTNNAPAVQLLCTGSLNQIEVLAGQVGIAIDPDQAAEVDQLKVRSGQVLIGRDVELSDLERTGGTVTSLGATVDGTVVL